MTATAETAVLEGRVAVVVGGSNGLGMAIGIALRRAGAKIVVLDLDTSSTEAGWQEVGMPPRVDVASFSWGELTRGFAEVEALVSHFDLLINATAADLAIPALDLDEATWDAAMTANAKAVFAASQLAARHFLAHKRRGKIINLSSNLGMISRPNHVAFCASQGAVLQTTRSHAVEWARHGINVNAIAVASEVIQASRQGAELEAEGTTAMGGTAIAALPAAAEIADSALYLAESRSDHLHGHVMVIDGGEVLV